MFLFLFSGVLLYIVLINLARWGIEHDPCNNCFKNCKKCPHKLKIYDGGVVEMPK